MINFDTTPARKAELQFNKIPNADAVYSFFYDETNNIKKFRVKEKGFNVSFDSNFVVGGVAYDGQRPDLSHVLKNLGLQKTVSEVKLKHLAEGCFEECLTSGKLNMFLRRIEDAPVYLHFSSMNILYWSIVDIVDSVIDIRSLQHGPAFLNQLKSDLYNVCRLEITAIQDIFYRYKYPNIKKEEVESFIDEFLPLLHKYTSDFDPGLYFLTELLEEARAEGDLPFLFEEEDLTPIKSLVGFYTRPIYVFINSQHFFDKEDEIAREIGEYRMTYEGKLITTYHFLDSKADIIIQISDVLMGLTGKLSTFINTFPWAEIEAKLLRFNQAQIDNLRIYMRLISKSLQKNPGFFHQIESSDNRQKYSAMLELFGE